MNPLSRFTKSSSARARIKRADTFKKLFRIDDQTKILDLGSGDGANITKVLEGMSAANKNVYISDINKKMLKDIQNRFGYTPVLLPESGRLPFDDDFFDIVFCSSVIEHVTVPKDRVWRMHSGKHFKEKAFSRQKEFAAEIMRVGKQYFVQTPYKYFPLETHTWLPFMGFCQDGC